MKARLVLAVLAAALAGCAHNRVTPGRTAIPVECKETVPDRPAMPTDRLKPGATTDAYVQAAEAEIDLREGYETKLRTALEACVKPIQPKSP